MGSLFALAVVLDAVVAFVGISAGVGTVVVVGLIGLNIDPPVWSVSVGVWHVVESIFCFI